ncbi:MAG: orotidine-5'-phosphate decarboxylase [Candidatus Marinimicrobia bacterium]|nr:orotidine-5'-phosphate decarboxylase [Candidatus Neomarinimicrobiota bacterium]
MKFIEKLKNSINTKKTYLCIGIDPDPEKLPPDFSKNVTGIMDYVTEVINLTKDITAAYKFNMAFFEVWGSRGWKIIEKIGNLIPEDIFLIADGKRGDIGNSARFYAKALLENLFFDAVTVSPYLGTDSIIPFIESEKKGAFVLCVTTNKSACKIQNFKENGKPLYVHVAEIVNNLNTKCNLGLVVGATKPKKLLELRDKFPSLPFLIPGIGAQGGDIEASRSVCKPDIGLINISRAILYPDSNKINEVKTKAIEFRKLLNKE